ncbi:ATP-binding cassette domain-containing protein [Mucilaginibacter sp. UC70_90]
MNFAEAEPVFPDFLTGTEMIALFTAAKGAPARQKEQYIKSMGMQSFIDRPVGTYSSGMMKKLSLLLAFLGNPKLILLDEPLITIDTASLAILNTWIRERYEQEGTSFLLSSHQILEDGSLPVTGELLVEEQTLKFIS